VSIRPSDSSSPPLPASLFPLSPFLHFIERQKKNRALEVVRLFYWFMVGQGRAYCHPSTYFLPLLHIITLDIFLTLKICYVFPAVPVFSLLPVPSRTVIIITCRAQADQILVAAAGLLHLCVHCHLAGLDKVLNKLWPDECQRV
jgi:hypothetical protein